MKNLYLTICLFLLSQTTVFSQYIVVENRIWSNKSTAEGGNGAFVMTYERLKGDTLINSHTYKTMWLAVELSPKNWYKSPGYLREEEGKVYHLEHSKALNENLLYNFNLKEGEIFHHVEANTDWMVDSVRIKEISGVNRKHIYLSNEDNIVQWIEGIGNLFHITGSMAPMTEHRAEVICVHENDLLIYQNPKYSDCSFRTAIKEPLINDHLISLFTEVPGEISLTQNNSSKGTITFLTLDGKQVLSTTLVEPETTLCAPATGLLLYRFVSTTGQVQTGKVMVR
jgi:hypothetical protein